MSNFEKLGGFLGQVGGYIRDIKVAEVSNNGTASTNVRPESIPDQTSVGQSAPAGPPSRLSIGGVALDGRMLAFTGAALAGLFAIRALR